MKNIKVTIILFFILMVGSIFYIKKDTVFISVKTNKLDSLIQTKDEKLIYIGRPTCPSCVEIEPILKEELKENNMKLYYYNTEKAKKNRTEFDKMKEKLEVEHIPLILYYKDGKVVKRFDYYDFIKSKDSVEKFIESIYN